MINRRINALCYIVLLFVVKIRLILGAQVTNSTSNQGGSPSLVQPRFSDLGAVGFPNFGSGRFGNPTSNYPTDSFFPFGNQNNNMQRPNGYPNQNPNQGNFQNRPIQGGYPNQQGYPYQGDSMNPNTNYQRPVYPNGGNGNQGNFPNGPIHGGFGNGPVHGGFGNQNSFPYQGDTMDRYPNYQRPPYPNRPNNVYSGTLNGPYQNVGIPPNEDQNFNQHRPTQGGPGQLFQRPPRDSEYPSQGNFQGPGHQNLRPGQIQNPSFRPDDINNLPNPNINYPNKPYQNHPNQYGPQTELPIQNNQHFGPGLGKPGSSQPYPSNYNPNTNIQYPTDTSGGDNDLSTIQFPNTGDIANSGETGEPPFRPDNFNNIPLNRPQIPNNQVMDPIIGPNYNDTVAILGKPVAVAPTTTPPGQIVFDNSTESPTMKKCVQDCQATSEYNPVCGSNNVTYVNPGKFVCARNCGVAVYFKKKGRCDGDAGFI